MAGALDPLIQAHTGLKYERDLTALASGPHAGYFLGLAMDMLNGFPKYDLGILQGGARNSENTDTAEHKAVKAAYKFFAVPAISAGLSAVPVAGPATGALAGAAMQKLTSNQTAGNFAGMFFDKAKPRDQLF